MGRKQHSLEKLAQEHGESLGGTHTPGIASKSSLGSQEAIRVNWLFPLYILEDLGPWSGKDYK